MDETSTAPTSSMEVTSTAPGSSTEVTNTMEVTSMPSTSSMEGTSTAPTSSTEETFSASTTSPEVTNTMEVTSTGPSSSTEETFIASTSSMEVTSIPSTSMEETSTAPTISTEENFPASPTSPEVTSIPFTTSTEETFTAPTSSMEVTSKAPGPSTEVTSTTDEASTSSTTSMEVTSIPSSTLDEASTSSTASMEVTSIPSSTLAEASTSSTTSMEVTSIPSSTLDEASTSSTTSMEVTSIPSSTSLDEVSTASTASTASTTTMEVTSTASTTTMEVTTSSSPPPPPVLPAVECLNGGTLVGSSCLCTKLFYGDRCQYSASTITTTIPSSGMLVAIMELEVTLTNFNLTEELQDQSSKAFLSFEEHFQREIKEIYGKIPNYQGVKIISLRHGSLVVDHEVLFTIAEEANITAELEEIKVELVEALNLTLQTQGFCVYNTSVLCLKETPRAINATTSSSFDVVCQQRVPLPYRDFYFALATEGLIQCATSCTPNLNTTLDCNRGQCRVTRDGPQCFCWEENLYWYSGEHCSGPISKVAMGLGLVATIFLLTSLLLALLLARDRCRRNRASQLLADDRWYEEDFVPQTWTSPWGFLYSNQATTSPPLGGHRPPAAPSTPTSSWRRPVGPPTTTSQHQPGGGGGQRTFSPSLELVDISTQMRTSRPQLATRH
ncbi:mucin-17-like [Melanerpes formicivorus]|uniref:mucin-17-like n=1 Tax=Melanerpes formicivorus TaxID=211600 RepID=UPI00358F71D5